MEDLMEKEAEAHLKSLTPKQITTLRYIESKTTIILERAYRDMGEPKQTLSYRLRRLEQWGLIETQSVGNDRVKPRQLTDLGKRVLSLLDKTSKDPLLEGIEDLPENLRETIKQARIEAQTIIMRLDYGNILCWSDLLKILEDSLRQARINAKLLSPPHKRATS